MQLLFFGDDPLLFYYTCDSSEKLQVQPHFIALSPTDSSFSLQPVNDPLKLSGFLQGSVVLSLLDEVIIRISGPVGFTKRLHSF